MPNDTLAPAPIDAMQSPPRFRRTRANKHWIRVVMNQRLAELTKDFAFSSMDAAEISGNSWRDRAFKSYANLSWPEYDVCRDTPPEPLDCVIAEQVWEHLPDPEAATRNVFGMLRPGGVFIISTPFMVRLHATPYDCSRWTPTGMRNLLVRSGFDAESLIVESWGNRACLVANLDQWVLYEPEIHSLENEWRTPLVVWAIARKAEA